ncbi:hypothetical protein [Clostridium sp. 'White wine YQ']|uniref:hypothetical protein n=1 Tax=Clostridium sp. 'White wine YQ' TaxID=3027474 RepID=UPI0023658A48|nr:hypothetical protein [Clostridium sp. 'White wine YQ']MDD7793412.1 hypothetical protein [Clostridium sp. 'White wine YQ']
MSILFIILNMLLILLLVIFVVKKNVVRFSMPNKIKKYIIAIYCAILIIGTILLNFIPTKNFVSINETNGQIEQIPSTDYFKNLASKGLLNTTDAYTQNQNISLDYTDKKLKITNDSNNITIICKIKDVDDGKIDIQNYVTNCSFNGVNIADKIIPSKITLKNNKLSIYDDSSFDIKFRKFDNDITTTQFLKSNSKNSDYLSPFFVMKIMYIQIPKNLQLDDSSMLSLDMMN